jgi:hypothetical protein
VDEMGLRNAKYPGSNLRGLKALFEMYCPKLLRNSKLLRNY